MRSHCLIGLVAGFLLLLPTSAHAHDVVFATGTGAGASTWRGDALAGQSLRLGFRFADVLSFDALGRLGYGTVDERLLTLLSLGVTAYGRIGKVRPYLGLAALHQHEEPVAYVGTNPFSAVLGVGDGIRHRAGGGLTLGAEIPIEQRRSTIIFFAVDASSAWFPDPRGPELYVAGALWLGIHQGL